ncbi:glutathione S-transferase domain-containing protein [Candidatus Saccharibacteria bacterium]|nr:glutathione S-transferase domain-containing protein [Candidatus Saccharibacteria bacterium]
MKLYVCFTTGGSKEHPCAKAYQSLIKAGYEPEIEAVKGIGFLSKPLPNTAGRKKMTKLKGNHHVPTLVLDDGTVVDGSKVIVAWAKKNPKKQ